MNRRKFVGILAAAPSLRGSAPGWLLGANTAVQGYGLYQAIELIRSLEFSVIEIHPMGGPEATPGSFPGFRYDAMNRSDREKLKRALRPFRQITTHLPYTGLNWLSRDAAERAHAVRTVDIALEGSANCGARLAVLHPQPLLNEPWHARQGEYVDALRRWAEMGRKLGTRLAIETGFPRSVDEFVGLVQAAGHENLGATIDVGHQGRFAELEALAAPGERAKRASIAAYNAVTGKIIERLGPKVFHLHVHDIDPATWAEHKPLIHGFVDYPGLFAQLRRSGYQGALVLEIGGAPERMPAYLRDAQGRLLSLMAA